MITALSEGKLSREELLRVSEVVFQQAGDLRAQGILKAVTFPVGVLSTADQVRTTLSFIDYEPLKTNAAYSIMWIGALRWMLDVFDIKLTGREMLIKDGIAAIGDLIESLSVGYAKSKITTGNREEVEKIKMFVKENVTDGYTKNCVLSYLGNLLHRDPGCKRALTWLMEAGAIDKELRDELDKIKAVRDRVHLPALREREHGSYKDDQFISAQKNMYMFIENMQKYHDSLLSKSGQEGKREGEKNDNYRR